MPSQNRQHVRVNVDEAMWPAGPSAFTSPAPYGLLAPNISRDVVEAAIAKYSRAIFSEIYFLNSLHHFCKYQ